MHLIAVGAKRSVTGGILLFAIAAWSIHPVSALRAQARDSGARRTIRLPQESAGIDAIATALMGAFDQVDLVALGEATNAGSIPICASHWPDYVASMGGQVSFAQRLEAEYPGRTLTVIPIGALARPSAVKAADIEPDYQKFDRALETTVRPVLVSLQRSPFKDFTTEILQAEP